jgi:predicted transposase YdaD
MIKSLVLPEGLEREFQEDLQRFEQERQMQYVTSIERMAKQEGSKQEARSLVLRLLARRVGSIAESLQTQIESLSLTQLEDLEEALLEFNRVEDLESWLQTHSLE